jgi:Papain-like cysteine protease AvrRpt2
MTVSIGFTMEEQEQDEWCWAANAISAAEYFGSTAWTQCLLANTQLNQSTCCTDGSSNECNKPWYLDKALTKTTCHFTYLNAPIALSEIVRYLTAGIAIEARIGWTDGAGNFDGSGHFVAVTTADLTTTSLHIQDPWYHSSDVGYEDFLQRYKTVGVWTDTYIIDRLQSPSAGTPRVLTTAELANLLQNDFDTASTNMKDGIDAPIYTLALDQAAKVGPLGKMRQTGIQRLSDVGVFERASTAKTFSIRSDERGLTQVRAVRAAMSDLQGACVLQIPGLLVTALVGKKGGKTAVKPIGRIPSFLEDRLYAKSEFEVLIQKQAQRKLTLIRELRGEERSI